MEESESQRPAGSGHIVSDIYEGYNNTQREILAIETRKTSYKLFTVAAVILILDIIAMAAAGIPISGVFIFALLLFPLIFTGLGILAFKEPFVAIIIGMIVIFGLWIYYAVVHDITFLLKGWIGKAIIIYLLFAGLQNAKEANRIRRELKA